MIIQYCLPNQDILDGLGIELPAVTQSHINLPGLALGIPYGQEVKDAEIIADTKFVLGTGERRFSIYTTIASIAGGSTPSDGQVEAYVLALAGQGWHVAASKLSQCDIEDVAARLAQKERCIARGANNSAMPGVTLYMAELGCAIATRGDGHRFLIRVENGVLYVHDLEDVEGLFVTLNYEDLFDISEDDEGGAF